MRLLPAVLWLVMSAVAVAEDDEQALAVRKVEVLGGSVVRDESSPNRPVIGVDLSGSRRLTGAYLDVLKALPRLKSLNLSNCHAVDNEGLQKIAAFEQLTSLNLEGVNVTRKGLKAVCALSQLRTLRLSGRWLSDADLLQLQNLKQLESLRLDGFRVTRNTMHRHGGATGYESKRPEVAAITRDLPRVATPVVNNNMLHIGFLSLAELPNLISLELDCNNCVDEDLTYVGRIKNLTSLSVIGNVTDQGIQELRNCHRLTNLEINSSQVTLGGLSALSDLSELTTLNVTVNLRVSRNPARVRQPPAPFPKNLKTLNLSNADVTDAEMKFICELEQLTELDLSQNQITDEGLREISRLKQLRTLNLSYNKITKNGAAEIARLTELNMLNMANNPIKDAGLAHLSQLKSLTSLDVVGTQGSDVGIQKLAVLEQLTSLRVGDERITDESLEQFKSWKRLINLTLFRCQVTPTGAMALSESESLAALELYGEQITDDFVYELGALAPLQQLKLHDSEITDEGLELVAEFPRLTFFSLHSCGEISGMGAKHLGRMRRLTELRIENELLGDDALDAISKLPSLQKLTLRQTRITHAGIKDFRQKMPHVSIEGFLQPKSYLIANDEVYEVNFEKE